MTSRQIDIDHDDNDDDEDYLLEVTPKGDQTGLLSASYALPRLMLEHAMSAQQLAAFRTHSGIVAVIEAPGSDWVTPLADAAKLMGHWGLHLDMKSKPKTKDDITRGQVLRALERGHRILGVSQNPPAYLPEGLAGAADIAVKVSLPDNVVIKRAIRAATGRYPRQMPADISRGLSYAEICLAIRKGSKPGECVARLISAKRAGTTVDADLSQVPPLDTLHGYGEAMDWAQRLISELDAWRRGELDFSALQRTVILASEPGLGKTTFVRSLAAAAGVPLFATSVSSWFANSSGYLDAVIKQIDQVFQNAAAVSPALLFLDEIEQVPRREALSDRAAEWWMPVVGRMLLTLDSANLGVSSKLIVVGATNHPEKLDSALIRPGRMSRIIRIGRPDKQALAGILRQHLGDDLAGTDLSGVAALGVGASGADVTEWVKVARSMARQNRRSMTLEDLLAQVAPPDDRSPEVDFRIAVHEAGHAVVMQVLGLSEVASISTISNGRSGGNTMVMAPSDLMSKSGLEGFVTFILSGRCAEESIIGSVSSGSGGNPNSDLSRATRMVAMAHASMGMGSQLLYRGDPQDIGNMLVMDFRLAQAVETDLQRLYADAMRIVAEYREAVHAVAGALLRERHLSGDRFREIFERHPPGSKTIELDGRDG